MAAQSRRIVQVAAAVVRRGSEVLVARRKVGTARAGEWEFPGGKLEPGERPEACLLRELAEEFELRAEVGRCLARHRHDYPDLRIELLSYAVRLDAEPTVMHAHDRTAWAAPCALLSWRLSAADVPLAAMLCAEQAGGEPPGRTAQG